MFPGLRGTGALFSSLTDWNLLLLFSVKKEKTSLPLNLGWVSSKLGNALLGWVWACEVWEMEHVCSKMLCLRGLKWNWENRTALKEATWRPRILIMGCRQSQILSMGFGKKESSFLEGNPLPGMSPEPDSKIPGKQRAGEQIFENVSLNWRHGASQLSCGLLQAECPLVDLGSGFLSSEKSKKRC